MLVRYFFDITCVAFTALLFWLLTTHAIRCYVEGRPLHPGQFLTARGFATLFVFLCQELGSLMLLAVLWPFPGRRLRLPTRSGRGAPVLLVPGYGLQRSGMWFLAAWLRQKGWSTVVVPSISGPSDRDPVRWMASRAEALEGVMQTVLEATGATRVILLGQGVGGLIARYYVEQMQHSSRVERLITLGTAHHGTGLAVFGGEALSGLLPGSPLMASFDSALAVSTARYDSISGALDACVLPPESGMLGAPHRDFRLESLGHHALVFSGKVFQLVRDLLEELTPSASPETPGAGTEVPGS